MARREYAQIYTSVWEDDGDFVALPGEQQRVFLMLFSQSDISCVGILTMRLPYWSRLSGDGEEDELHKNLLALAEARFLVIDWDRQLVLVRSFMRWDKGYKNYKRRMAIVKEASSVRSRPIRDALIAEFERCGLDPLPTRPVPADEDQMEIDIPDSPESLFSQVEGQYQDQDVPCQNQDVPGKYLSTVVSNNQEPGTRNQEPGSTSPAPAQAPPRAAALPEITAQDVVAEWVDAVEANGVKPARNQCGQVGKLAKELLEAGNDPDRVLAAARQAGTKGYPSIERELTTMAAPPVQARPRSTTRERVEQAMALRPPEFGGFPELPGLPDRPVIEGEPPIWR